MLVFVYSLTFLYLLWIQFYLECIYSHTNTHESVWESELRGKRGREQKTKTSTEDKQNFFVFTHDFLKKKM